MAPRKLIIDTDPGVDDALAILLACSAAPEELELLLISVTYGNVDVQNCLRNVVSLFHYIEKEIEWRKAQNRPIGFETLLSRKPLVAVGPEYPLAEEMFMADYFHGKDGLGNIYETHPQMNPAGTWKQLFQKAKTSSNPDEQALAEEMQNSSSLFKASREPSSQEILRLLRENEADSITIVAIGPMTNLALAAAADPVTFLRAKEVVVMGGTVQNPGNITPCAEFNTFADAYAAARVYALSSPDPSSTMPPPPPSPHPSHMNGNHGFIPPTFLSQYPSPLPRRLKITLFPLDITQKHRLTRGVFNVITTPLLVQDSPLATWISAFMTSTFTKIESLQQGASGDTVHIDMHDPLCIWYCLADGEKSALNAKWTFVEDEDVRIETSGQWTRGMCVVDRRMRKRREDDQAGEQPGDTGNWLGKRSGHRLRRCTGSPGEEVFGSLLLERIFFL